MIFCLLLLWIHPSFGATPAPALNSQKAFHLLNRLAYGPRPGELEELTLSGEAGIDAWIEKQLHPETIADLESEDRVAKLKAWSMSIEQLHEEYPQPKAKSPDAPPRDPAHRPQAMLQSLFAQKLIRAVESKRQLQEVLEDFWFNHFNVDFRKGQVKWYLVSYERDSIRPHLFGKFRDLLGAVAKSPAMLFYLDNFQSVRDGFVRGGFRQAGDDLPSHLGLNENYGRELLELHTLGVDGGYTQTDVREAARALTGWSIEQPRKSARFMFRVRAHDEGAKHILTLNLPAGQGLDDGEKLLDMLARHPATAHFIAKKLCIRFISDRPPESAVKKLAEVFLQTDGDLSQVYRTLFHLPEFWAASTRRAKIKTPWEFVVSAARALGGTVEVPEQGPRRIFQVLNKLGEPPYQCQPPTGFKMTADAWVNPGALVTRINFALALAGDRFPEIDIDRGYFRKRLYQDGQPKLEVSIEKLNQWILGGEMRPETQSGLIKELNSEEKVFGDGSEGGSKPILNLAKLLGLVLGSPEFQRR